MPAHWRLHRQRLHIMHIQPAQHQDIPRIKELYDEAIAFQRRRAVPFWRDPDLSVVGADIDAGCQYLLVLEGEVAGIFSLCPPSPMDQDLWRGRDPQAARYIHRIIVARRWGGRTLLAPMLAWAERDVLRLGLDRLRLDTWADNPALVDYYARFGFTYLGEHTTSNSPALAPQYRKVRLAVMEKRLSAPQAGARLTN